MPYNLQLLFSLTLRMHCKHTCLLYMAWLAYTYTIHISYTACLHDAVLVPPFVALPQRGAFDLNWVVARSHNYANCVDAAAKESTRFEVNTHILYMYIYIYIYIKYEGVSAIFGVFVGPWQEAEVLNLDCFMQRQRQLATPRFEDGRPLAKCPTHLALKRWLFYVFSVIIIVVVMLIFYYCCRCRCCCCC